MVTQACDWYPEFAMATRIRCKSSGGGSSPQTTFTLDGRRGVSSRESKLGSALELPDWAAIPGSKIEIWPQGPTRHPLRRAAVGRRTLKS
jgi:hypothetical protein